MSSYHWSVPIQSSSTHPECSPRQGLEADIQTLQLHPLGTCEPFQSV